MKSQFEWTYSQEYGCIGGIWAVRKYTSEYIDVGRRKTTTIVDIMKRRRKRERVVLLSVRRPETWAL